MHDLFLERRVRGQPDGVEIAGLFKTSARSVTARRSDPRSKVDATHDLASLLRTSVLLAAQGWRDHDDADSLRHDPAFRLATGSAAGLTRLEGPGLA